MLTKFEEMIRALSDSNQPLTAEVIYGLSDLNDDELQQLQSSWGAISLDRRRSLIRRLVESAETNFDLDFTGVTRLALTDLDDEVREIAVEATWTDESPEMLRRLLIMASGDIAPRVRAAAASALGAYILQGELGQLDPMLARQAENVAIKLYENQEESLDVRRRALESIANCGRAGIDTMIEQAYQHPNAQMRASAIFAMGRTCDSRWEPVVIRELASDDPEMRYEAARAAGEIEMREAVPYLGELLNDEDREVMEMSVWALGEIGGNAARNLLEDLMERADTEGDDELGAAIEEALENAELAGMELDL